MKPMLKRSSIILLLGSLWIPVMAEDGGIRIVSWPTPVMSVSSAAVTTVSVGPVTAILLASRTGRLKAVFFNEKETLYVKAGTGASSSDYTWRVPAATTLEVTAYTGPITAVLTVTGPTTVHVTDF